MVANDIIRFKVGKVYKGSERNSRTGNIVGTGLFLCTKITQKKNRGNTFTYCSMHEVYKSPGVDLHWPTRVCKIRARGGLRDGPLVEEVYNAGLHGAYEVSAKDEYDGPWYEPKPTVCYVYHPRPNVVIADYNVPFESMATAKKYATSIYDDVAKKEGLPAMVFRTPLDIGYPTKGIVMWKTEYSSKPLGFVVKSQSGKFFWIANKKGAKATKLTFRR